MVRTFFLPRDIFHTTQYLPKDQILVLKYISLDSTSKSDNSYSSIEIKLQIQKEL
jgi:hypothetical protein